jgi:hypothetical protein
MIRPSVSTSAFVVLMKPPVRSNHGGEIWRTCRPKGSVGT